MPTSASQLDLEQLICNRDAEPPSAATHRPRKQDGSAAVADIATIARARGLNAKKLRKRLRGDLDAIVMRALRKEPQHRYASVEQLAADIRRHLNNEPVRARQGNWVYYSRRFMRRHALGVSVGATFVVLGVAFVMAMSVQSRAVAAERDRATQESSRAESVSDFMLEVFSASDPFKSQGQETTARELLDVAAKRIRNDLAQQPEVRARLLEAIGKSYRRQNQLKQAEEILQEAVSVNRQLTDSKGSKTAPVLLELAIAQRLQNDQVAAQITLHEAAQLLHQASEQRSLTYAGVLREFGLVAQLTGNLEAARKYLEGSLTLYRELLGSAHTEVARTYVYLVGAALWSDDLSRAERLAREALNIFEQAVPELHPDRVGAEGDLGDILLLKGRVDEAVIIFERVLDRSKMLFGEESRQVGAVCISLAEAAVAAGKLRTAEKYARIALDAYRKSVGEDHYESAYARTTLATILLRRGVFGEAESLLRGSLNSYSKTLPPDHQYVASSEYFLGEVLLREGKLADAESILTASMSRWRRTDAAFWRSLRSQSALGEVLYREGRCAEAERYLVDSYQALTLDEKADQEARTQAHERLSRFYQERGEMQKLRALRPPLGSDLRASR